MPRDLNIITGLYEDRYFDGLLNQHLAKGDKAEATEDRIKEVADSIFDVKMAEIATVKSHQDSRGYTRTSSPLQDMIGEIDDVKMSGLGALIKIGKFELIGEMLYSFVTEQARKEAKDEAEQQVDEENGEYL